jgi:hypothetical protein
MKLVRLEKENAKLESNSKLGGIDNGYALEGKSSPIRFSSGKQISFVISTGAKGANSPQADSAMRASGYDPNTMGDPMAMMNDPARTTNLYGANLEKNKRVITTQAFSGMKLGKAKKESTKYTLSIKKIREGYYELVVDKLLPRGEYAFVVTNYGSMDNSAMLFAFGVD